jgi:hypothetical protein
MAEPMRFALCTTLSLIVATPVAAANLCDDVETVHATLEKYTQDPQPVTDSVHVSASAVFGFPNCQMQWSQNSRNELQYVCDYEISLAGKSRQEIDAIVDAQDLFLNDLTEQLLTCMEAKEFDYSATGMASEHLGRLLGIYFEDDSVLAVDISGGSWSNVCATLIATYGEKRPDR